MTMGRQQAVIDTIECAGNGRVFFVERFGKAAEGTQWRTGAISTAETGVRPRTLFELAGLTSRSRDVMPEGLDELRLDRPMPLATALAEDTVVAPAVNGEPLPADRGFPRGSWCPVGSAPRASNGSGAPGHRHHATVTGMREEPAVHGRQYGVNA